MCRHKVLVKQVLVCAARFGQMRQWAAVVVQVVLLGYWQGTKRVGRKRQPHLLQVVSMGSLGRLKSFKAADRGQGAGLVH